MKNRSRFLPALLLLAASAAGAEEPAAGLVVEKLTWAGVKLSDADTTVFIDAIGTDIWDGNAPGGLVPVTSDTRRTYALITHAHNDHFDVATLKEVLGERGYVICHESIATYVVSRGLQVIPVATWEPVRRGGFIFTPVPASDGFGAEQVSWVVTHGENRYFHGGDTLWHGHWDLIGTQYGPFDAAFLPINGARMQREPEQETPAMLTPEQAVDAALQLRARQAVPIHYGGSSPPAYVEVPEPLESFLATAKRRDLPVQALQPGERLNP